MDLLRSAILVVLVGFVLCAVPPNLPIWTITLGRCKPGNGEYKIVRMNSMVGRDCMILAVGVAEEQGFEVWGFGWRDGRCSVYYQSLTTLNVPQPIGKPWDFEDFIGKTGNGPPVNTSGKPSNQSADPLKCFSGIHCMRVFAGNRYCQLPAFGAPASVPTADPATVPTGVPTAVPTSVPATVQPPGFTAKPTSTVVPTTQPTVQPPGPTPIPTPVPTAVPCATPTAEPTLSPAAVASSPTPHPASSNKTLSSIKALCSCSSLTPSSILNTGLWYCGGRGIVRGICLEAQAPGSTCPSGYVKCPTKLNIFAKHRNSGKACGCNNYQNGAVDSDAVLCWSWNFCGLPKINGRCATGFNACSGTTVIRLLISSPLRTLSSKLADACGVKEDRIHILSRCPEEACPAGVCLPTLSQRQSKGCLTSSRTSNALILDDTVQEKLYIDFDILENDDVVRNEKIIQLYANVDEIRTSGAIDASDPQLVALKDLEVNAVSTELPPVEKTMPPVEDESSLLSQYWWAIVLGSMILITAGIIIRKRVTFSDATDFKASQPEEKPLPRGMEGCHRAHRGLRRQPRRGGRIAGLNSDEQEICIDMPELSSEYQAYPSMPYVARSHGRGSKCSVRSRSASSSGSSEPEMSI